MIFRPLLSGGALLGALLFANTALAQSADLAHGEQIYTTRCKTCHEPAIERAPGRAELATRSRADIVTALTSGVMKPMATGLSDGDIQAVAAYLTAPAPAPASGSARAPRPAPPALGQDKMCTGPAPALVAGAGDWGSVNLDSRGSRHQPTPGFTAAEVPRLAVKWSFAMPGGGSPTVVGDWLFINNRSGKFYALDAKTGCVRWVREGVASRTTPAVVKSATSPSGWLVLAGVSSTKTLRAFDAMTGADLWKSEPLESLAVAGITGSPIVSGDRVFVPLTSGEEGAAIQKTYSCCVFRGSLAAVDLKTGRTLWRTSMVDEPLRSIGKNEAGTPLQGPAGAAIWGAPTADQKRGLVYVVTGDSYTSLDAKRADAVVALDMATGKIRWANQLTIGDNYVMACETQYKGPNCPHNRGPDFDFGASPILMTLKSGKGVVVAGQKSGDLHGLDAATGKRLWTKKLGAGSQLGGIEWGIAADDRTVFVPVADTIPAIEEARLTLGMKPLGDDENSKAVGKPGINAVDAATGRVLWTVAAPKAGCRYAGDRSKDFSGGACVRAQSAPASVAAGLVFSGTLDGWMRAYDVKTGRIVWAYSTTAGSYDTVNGVKGHPGGGIDGMGGGPVIAHGMLYAMSGFNGASQTGSNGVNVLLAFSVDGR